MNEVTNVPKFRISINTLIYPAIACLITASLYKYGVFLPSAIIISLIAIFIIIFVRVVLRRQEYERWLVGLGKNAPLNYEKNSLRVLGAIPFNNRMFFINVSVNTKGVVLESKRNQRYIGWDEMLSVERVNFQGKHNLQLKLYRAAPYNLINIPWDKSANNYVPSRLGL